MRLVFSFLSLVADGHLVAHVVVLGALMGEFSGLLDIRAVVLDAFVVAGLLRIVLITLRLWAIAS